MCVGRGDKWLLEKRATDGAVCPPGGKIESRQSMYELERNAVGTQVTVYTETALQAVIRESREEVEFTNAAGEVFEPRYKWIASFDEGVYNFEAFATVIDVNAEIASKEPNKARLLWAKLDEWRAFDTLTRSSVVVMGMKNRGLRNRVENDISGRKVSKTCSDGAVRNFPEFYRP